MDDTWHSLGRILLLVMICILPIVIVQSVLWLIIATAFTGLPQLPFHVFLAAAPKLLSVWVLAAASAYVYQCYANRLAAPPSTSSRG
jgi:hypothetical protein